MAIRDAADLLAHTNTKSRAPYPFRNDTRRTDATQRSSVRRWGKNTLRIPESTARSRFAVTDENNEQTGGRGDPAEGPTQILLWCIVEARRENSLTRTSYVVLDGMVATTCKLSRGKERSGRKSDLLLEPRPYLGIRRTEVDSPFLIFRKRSNRARATRKMQKSTTAKRSAGVCPWTYTFRTTTKLIWWL
jgi:hypothetical protein